MKYTEEMKTIEQAKSKLLRGNDIESATLILEKVILDGMIIKCGRINILKVAARQIINFIEEYKNKEYLDVVREKVYANEESRRKDELIEKQQKKIEILTASKFCMTSTRYARQPLFNSIYEHSDSLEKIYRLENISGHTIDDLIKLFLDGFVLVSKEDIRAREEDSNLKCAELSKLKIGGDLSYDDYIHKEAIVNVLNKYAHEPIEEPVVINFYKELKKLLGE